MKKLLFQNFTKDTFKFFLTTCFSISAIVWVIQAVNFLDFVTEDGHGLSVYLSYTILNFPKIIHRILPFVFFISLFYQIIQYERRNEFLIFWTYGINKLHFINTIIVHSLLYVLFQILLGGFISPLTQDKARSFIRNSNIDFFPSLIREGKFIDTVKKLTIYIESKDQLGNYKNVYLEENFKNEVSINDKKSQTIFAKRGLLKVNAGKRYLELTNGEIIDKTGKKIKSFSFEKINFDLSKYTSKTTTFPKIQEINSVALAKCLYFFSVKRLELFSYPFLNCTERKIKNVREEFFKRFLKPIYIPLMSLIVCFIILSSKEEKKYNIKKNLILVLGFLIIVISEVSLRYVGYNLIGAIFFIFFPLVIFTSVYFYLLQKLRANY